jgi:hypothetical protein
MEVSDCAATWINVGLSEPTSTRIGIEMSIVGAGSVEMVRMRGVFELERGVFMPERRRPMRGVENVSAEVRGVTRCDVAVAMIGSGAGEGWVREIRLRGGGEVGRVSAWRLRGVILYIAEGGV